MLKKAWFQIHWFIGITAGVVLAVVGVTGAVLSFEHELKTWMNPGVMTVEPKPVAALTPAELMARVQESHPDRRITSLALSAAPTDAARIVFAAKAGDTANRRGEAFYFDPYSGGLLGKPAGEDLFRLVMQIHRWLAAGDVGKHIVGASTIALVVLCLSGLYLRWPRNAMNWRTWLTFDTRRRGRSFLWDLHAVAGTWTLALYLLAALTGLYWSYDWYRNGLFAITGVPRPAQQARPGQADGADKRTAPPRKTDMAAVWAGFQRESGDFRTVTLRLPEKPGQPVQATYLDRHPAHDRAFNRLVLDAQSGAAVRHERYDAKPIGAKLMSSMLALHSGSFFGLPGLLLMMLASLLMPLFAVTGWMLYLERRRMKKDLRSARQAAAPVTAGTAVSEWLIGFASQTGFAEQLAWQTAGSLRAAGMTATVEPLGHISAERLRRFTNVLFVVSTFGEGQPPDHARSFAKLMRQQLPLAGLRFGLLALGSSQYQTFCGFGRALDNWLCGQGAQPLFPRVEIDDRDSGALTVWRNRLGMLSGTAPTESTDVPYESWRLVERRLLNPGSRGGPVFHLVLQAPAGSVASWQAGDLVDILPHAAEQPDALPARQYSIASLPQDGAMHLLVRQVRHTDGLGMASGWLTHDAPVGGFVALRLRSNRRFHPPPGGRPLILIGNGTGAAGLRSHLQARVRDGHGRNWLIFGERNRVCDFYFQDEIERWQAQGMLKRLDLAFSRDQGERIYVQDRMRASAEVLRAWVADGAAILVCGSLNGMAPAVDQALADIIGKEALEQLIVEDRYRRDVY